MDNAITNLGGIKCVSFDVFDTCLVRNVAAPSEVFRDVGLRLAKQHGIADDEDFAEQFVHWRVNAEKTVVQSANQEEVTLREIWETLHTLLPRRLGVCTEGPELELAAERSLLGPILTIRQRLEEVRAQGVRVVFTSDTYLPEAFLRECLTEHGFFHDADGLYVSSAVRKSKRTGNLFRHLLLVEHLDAHEVLHIGDHRQSDYVVPRRLGVNAEHFDHASLRHTERLLVKKRPPGARHWSTTAARLRFDRLTKTPGVARSPAEQIVEDFIGPFLCMFALWILDRAQRDGVERLYFAARDTRLLWSVAKRLNEKTQYAIDCRYLYISRRAVLLPAVTEVSEAGIPWLFRAFEPAILEPLLAKLELTYQDVESYWKATYPGWRLSQPLTTVEQRDALWQILQRPEVAARILNHAQNRRRGALAYFRQAGVCDECRNGYVDLGWHLTCQAAINAICHDAPKHKPIQGYYLALWQERLGAAEAGDATAVYYGTPSDQLPPEYIQRLKRRVNLLEHVIGLADHASTLGYSDIGEPQTPNTPVQQSNLVLFQEIESALLRYVDRSSDSWRALMSESPNVGVLLVDLMDGFFEAPDSECASTLSTIEVTSDQNNRDARALVQPYTWPETLSELLPVKLRFPRKKGIAHRDWPEASWMATTFARRGLVRASRALRPMYTALKLE